MLEEAVKDLVRWIDCQEDVGKWALGTRYALNRVRAALALKEREPVEAPCPSEAEGGKVASC